MSSVAKLWLILVATIAVCAATIFLFQSYVFAININNFRDTISDSAPAAQTNHTFDFLLKTNVSPGGQIEITFPSGGSLPTSTLAVRNVELLVNGSPRVAAETPAPGVDGVEITAGSPGFLRYTLAPDAGLAAEDRLQIKVGNHTSLALRPTEVFSTSTGTTTVPGDSEPLTNPPDTGTHRVKMEIYDGTLVADAGFVIAIVERVQVPNIDTTEEIPPLRFNGSPTSTVGGTTLSVEISLETDEFAVCRYSTNPGISYSLMPNTFTNTGLIFHSKVVAVTPDSLASFYIRCIDDEGNFNIDDFLIEFVVNEAPTGESNTDGDVDGDGTGTGNDGSGSGSGSGGQTGDSDGEEPEAGTTSGSGGGGGGGGGGSGRDSGATAGGGFESTDAPFRSGDGRVIINGFAFPNSDVTILVDGKVAERTNTNASGQYSITLDEIARGAYTFGVFAEGPDGVKSSTLSTSFTVTGARTSSLSNINIAPSISVTPNPVDPGQVLTASGYGLPDSVITLQNAVINSSQIQTQTVNTDNRGRWEATIDTSGFTRGTYQIRARSEQSGGRRTNYSDNVFYGVGQAADVPLNTDLNRDGRVNLTDFSILLFWWGGNGGDSNPPADINQDGRVSLTDFSILLFNWTG